MSKFWEEEEEEGLKELTAEELKEKLGITDECDPEEVVAACHTTEEREMVEPNCRSRRVEKITFLTEVESDDCKKILNKLKETEKNIDWSCYCTIDEMTDKNQKEAWRSKQKSTFLEEKEGHEIYLKIMLHLIQSNRFAGEQLMVMLDIVKNGKLCEYVKMEEQDDCLAKAKKEFERTQKNLMDWMAHSPVQTTALEDECRRSLETTKTADAKEKLIEKLIEERNKKEENNHNELTRFMLKLDSEKMEESGVEVKKKEGKIKKMEDVCPREKTKKYKKCDGKKWASKCNKVMWTPFEDI